MGNLICCLPHAETDSLCAPPRRASQAQAQPIKKALLIGTGYEGTPVSISGFPPLQHAHTDTTALAELLVSSYGYPPENIAVLLDEQDGDPQLAPTKHNIIRKIRWLVDGASSQDHLFFYYSGHSGKTAGSIPGRDEFDRYLIPCDYWDHPEGMPHEKMILNCELRRLLVDPLPVGTHFRAVFDSCYSGRFLDLVNDRFKKPGPKSPGRRNACFEEELESFLARPGGRLSWLRNGRHSAAAANRRSSSLSTIQIVGLRRLSDDAIRIADTSVNVIDQGNGKRRQFSICSRKCSIQSRTSSSAPLLADSDSCHQFPLERYESPTEMLTCGESQVHEGPDVLVVSASGPSQETFDSTHYSFSKCFIHALQLDPHQPIGRLLHTLTLAAHEQGRKYRAWKKRMQKAASSKVKPSSRRRGSGPPNPPQREPSRELLHPVFEPQVESPSPVAMHRLFDL